LYVHKTMLFFSLRVVVEQLFEEICVPVSKDKVQKSFFLFVLQPV
jgi:hypothetical protein